MVGWPGFRSSETSSYVDIVSGMARTQALVTMVDLDLDVIRRRDGSIELLGEDEFALHQVELGYPTQLIEHAERMADHVLSAVRSNVAPFDGVAASEWMNQRTDPPDAE